ncbi:hypothetical protein J6590_021338 [Homalodisca vitripennis]|nr:hypothetical protein J6590_021338 [Homalodisca vitripennis]
MASVRDTATFFTEGSASQFEHVLSLYPQALRLKAEMKNKKPEELIKLDNCRLLAIKECFPPETARSLARWRSLNAKRVTWESMSTYGLANFKINSEP